MTAAAAATQLLGLVFVGVGLWLVAPFLAWLWAGVALFLFGLLMERQQLRATEGDADARASEHA
jgi:hypothetical protein